MISMLVQGIIREEKWNLQEIKINDSYAKLRGQEASTHGLIKMAMEVSEREREREREEKIRFHILLNIIYLLFPVNLIEIIFIF